MAPKETLISYIILHNFICMLYLFFFFTFFLALSFLITKLELYPTVKFESCYFFLLNIAKIIFPYKFYSKIWP